MMLRQIVVPTYQAVVDVVVIAEKLLLFEQKTYKSRFLASIVKP